MTPEVIKDRETLERWLQTRPGKDSAHIAYRAALRALPLYTVAAEVPWPLHDRLDSLLVLRTLITAQVRIHPLSRDERLDLAAIAASARVPNIHQLAAEAGSHEYLKNRSQIAGAQAGAFAAYAADSASSALEATSKSAAAMQAIDAASSIFDFAPILFQAAHDTTNIANGHDPATFRLWSGNEEAISMDAWDQTCTLWQTSGSPYAFWRRWYQSALDGKPLNPELLRDIALIPDDDWQKGETHIAGLIAGIEEEHAKRTRGADADGDPQFRTVPTINTKVILLQLDVLSTLVKEEINRMRGINSLPDIEHAKLAVRIDLLSRIERYITAIRLALEDQTQSQSTALMVINENLPMVVDKAQELVAEGGTPNLSQSIVTIGATIKFLTESGTPGHMATGIAIVDAISTTIGKFLTKPKKSK